MVRRPVNPIVELTHKTEEADMTTTDTRRSSIPALCEALGVPRQDWALFSRWAGGPLTSKALDELYHHVDVLIADRCRRPTDDLLHRLIQMDLTDEDIRGFVAALVTGCAD
jgi:cytochrome P450